MHGARRSQLTHRGAVGRQTLQLLIDATARVVKQGYEVEVAVAQFFRKPEQAESEDAETAAPSPFEVRFMPEDSDADQDGSDGFALSTPDALEARASAVADLLDQFDLVRREASA